MMDLELAERRLGKLKDNKLARQKVRASHMKKSTSAPAKKKEQGGSTGAAEKFHSMDEHKIKLEDLIKRLDTSLEKGLTDEEAAEKRKVFGLNVLSEKKKTPWFVTLAKEATGLFQLVLWAGSGLSLLVYGLSTVDPSTLYLAIALVIIIVLTTLITFVQFKKSEAVVAGFKNFIPPEARCLRNGVWVKILAEKLVPGDVVEIVSGNKIPADMRITLSNEMKVNNSSLTGESDALLRTVDCTHPDHPLETFNLAFFGTLCQDGSGRGIVISTGDNTVIGEIAKLATAGRTEETPLTKEINRFIKGMAAIASSFGLTFFILGFIIGNPAVNNVSFAIGIIVANLPEGLLTTLTVCITLAAQRLAVSKVLVKNLDCVETLGSTTVICSDKTGTLTQNRMTVANLWYDGNIYKADNYQKFGPTHKYEYDVNCQGYKDLHETAVLGSDAIFNVSVPDDKLSDLENIKDEKKRREERAKIESWYQRELEKKLWLDRPAIGDASETGLIKFFQPIQDILETRKTHQTLKMNDSSESKLPFNSTNKFAINIVDYETQDSHACIFMKGAPERIWKLCTHVSINGEKQPIDERWNTEFENVNMFFGKKGQRVLGFAKFHLPKDHFPEGFQYNTKSVDQFNFPINRLVFVGLISLIDPPREVVPFSVLKCQSAGIKVIMVTGDQPVTATAIARDVNIIKKDAKTVNEIAEEKGISLEAAMDLSDAIVIHGDLITKATKEDEELPENERGKKLISWLSKPQVVFARTSPAQKLIIVQGCQRLGNIVAVTGDGVNDSPAIKKADIGISMGLTGSDVAKDAADMILLTDDFSAIVVGVEEGRKIMDNIKRCLVYALTSNIPELIPFLSMVILGFPLPLSNLLMLCINIGTDLFPSFSLAWEDGELDLMLRKPRSRTDHLFTRKLLGVAYFQMGSLQVFGAFLCYFTVMNDFGFPPTQLFYKQFKGALVGSLEDAYDPYSPTLGNTNVGNLCSQVTGTPYSIPDAYLTKIDWLYLANAYNDLRNAFIECDGHGAVQSEITYSDCQIKQLSTITNLPICYTTEALKYTHTAVFFGIVFCQFTNVLAIKTKKLSIYSQGFRNRVLFGGLASEISLTFILSGWIFLHKPLGSRDVTFYHYGLPAIPFSIMQMIWEELRKVMIRKDDKTRKPGDKPNWMTRNSYY